MLLKKNSFISPIGHKKWWENSPNGSFGPKIYPEFGTIPSGGGQNHPTQSQFQDVRAFARQSTLDCYQKLL